MPSLIVCTADGFSRLGLAVLEPRERCLQFRRFWHHSLSQFTDLALKMPALGAFSRKGREKGSSLAR